MINLKPQIVEVLEGVCSNVSFVYPKSFAKLPAISYKEASNLPNTVADDEEYDSELVYDIDIWSDRSTSDLAEQVDTAMKNIGFKRVMCHDITDPSGLNHKVMKYKTVS
jgi:hypothetical protein